MMINKIIFILFLITTNLFSGSINIAVSTNVSYAIDELIKEFNTDHKDTKVRVTLGGSGKLTAQIKNKAPYMLFMSANMNYPNSLHLSGDAITKPRVYAQGSLAMFSSKKQDFSKGLELTLSSDISKIAIANPKTAPYGKATVEALKNAHIYEKIKRKFVYGESISQSVSYAMVATDLGFIAKSSLFSPKMAKFKKGINWVDIDAKLYTPIDQGIVILKEAKDNPEVRAFYEFIFSTKAKEIFKKFGYSVL